MMLAYMEAITPTELQSPIVTTWGGLLTPTAHKRWMQHYWEAFFRVTAMIGDAVATAAALVLNFTYWAHAVPPIAPAASPWAYAVLGTATLMGALAYEGAYKLPLLLSRGDQTVKITTVIFWWSLLFFGGLVTLSQGRINLPCAASSTFCALSLLLAWHLIIRRVLKLENVSSLLRHRIVLLGWTGEAGRFSRQVWEGRTDPCEIIGYVEFLKPMIEAETANLNCLGTVRDLGKIIQRHHADVALLADMSVSADEIIRLSEICQREMVEFKFIPSCFPTLVSGMHVEWLANTPVIGIDHLRLNRLQVRLLKRTMDIAGGLVGLILSAPLIALFAFLVYLESPGPVFYRQERIGRKGKHFDMVKIRSMKPDAERPGQVGWSVKDDPRRLKIGAFMRRWNIDELPQFWNVLKGDMSLVGPRPERPQLISNFKYQITNYNARHIVKPGVTGWAQVNGFRGDTDLGDRVKFDLFYIENWSVLLDIKTMWMTLFNHKNAC
jgi:exopolysaccharide biosynthesis polyprenyl glycosylphosphotransferase